MYVSEIMVNTAWDVGTATPPIEQVSCIHQNTVDILRDANGALGTLLSKVRGSQPEKTGGAIAKMPERFLIADAREMRNLASEIFEKTKELHSYIGHDK